MVFEIIGNKSKLKYHSQSVCSFCYSSLLSPNHPDPSSFRHSGFKPVRILHLVRLTHNKFSTKLRLSAGSGTAILKDIMLALHIHL
ncbi:unnamed protein product [Urochloa humidicola]